MMEFTIEKTLDLHIQEKVKRVSVDLEYEVENIYSNVEIDGQITVIRELQSGNDTTEIINRIPVEIIILENRLIDSSQNTELYINGVNITFDEVSTTIFLHLTLTNVSEKNETLDEK